MLVLPIADDNSVCVSDVSKDQFQSQACEHQSKDKGPDQTKPVDDEGTYMPVAPIS